MIETEQRVVIAAPIAAVWDYARDIGGWAKLMPGFQDCAVIDGDESRWTLKVGVGALVRTVRVLVHVDRWAGPDEVDFTYRLEGDPVSGGGTYRASPLGADETEMTLAVRVVGEGPMAPMWEAMGKPLLPRFALGFAEKFKAEVEAASSPEAPPPDDATASPRPTVGERFAAGRRRLFGSASSTLVSSEGTSS